MNDLRLVKKIPYYLRNAFWKNFIEAIEQEFELFNSDRIEKKKNLYNIAEMDYDRLREISATLGVLFDASINDSIEFLRKEVEAIPFKIKYKSTVRLYESFFKSLDRQGEIYVYYFKKTSDALVRNAEDLLKNLVGYDLTTPYPHSSSHIFTGQIEDALKLDTGLILDIENEGVIWELDTVESEISTNHLGLEFFIDRIITKEVRDENDNLVNKEFLMTWEYMDFIQVNTDFSRRVKEVPHVGCQLTAITDSSGVYDNLSDDYSTPSIKLKTLTTGSFSNIISALNLSYIEFGIGTYPNLNSKYAPGTSPNQLEQRVARNFVLFDEKYEDGNYIGGTAEYRGQQINRFLLHNQDGYQLDDPYGQGDVDGDNNDFRGTLPFAPIQKGNVRFVFYHDDLLYEIIDDRKGHLIGLGAYGDLDYQTGEYSFSTDIDYYAEDIVFTGDGSSTEVYTELDLPSPIQSLPTTNPDDPHFWIIYNVGNRTYITKDDGYGNIAGEKITSGAIDYEHGIINIIFSEPITANENVIYRYQYNKITTPDPNTEIKVDFYFTVQSIEITEAGLFDENDEMIAYATFPPIEFTSSRNHLSMAFIIKKTPFD